MKTNIVLRVRVNGCVYEAQRVFVGESLEIEDLNGHRHVMPRTGDVEIETAPRGWSIVEA